MEVKEAVRSAKGFVSDLLADEKLFDLGLEEIEFLDDKDAWDVTVGFSRPWNLTRGTLKAITGEDSTKRSYRVVRIRNSDGKILSMRQRETVE